VYDAESPRCRGLIDWVQVRDRAGLVVAFPFQNSELVRVAPELAGLNLEGEVHGFDTRSRHIDRGAQMLPDVLGRLPGWSWLAPLMALPMTARLFYAFLLRRRN
jgi:hypothetical protein